MSTAGHSRSTTQHLLANRLWTDTDGGSFSLGASGYAAQWRSPGFLTLDQFDRGALRQVVDPTDGGNSATGSVRAASTRTLAGGTLTSLLYGRTGGWLLYLNIPPACGKSKLRCGVTSVSPILAYGRDARSSTISKRGVVWLRNLQLRLHRGFCTMLGYILFARMKVIVIIPAAGLGTRMVSAPAGKDRKAAASKQFLELDGIPVLVHTLRRFAQSPQINEIFVALRKSEIEPFRARLERESPDILKKNTVLLEGGDNRQQSVANALSAVSAAEDDLVLVHDAVRPFVNDEIIGNVIATAAKYGAAITGVPAVDTVKQVERTAEGALIKTTIPREKVVMAQTPQGFLYDVIKKAFDEATADGFIGTDEASLVERSGHQVAVVMGSPRNIKITTPADLELAKFYSAQIASEAK